MFDTELLKSFVAVAESGGFIGAAARLNSTPLTVSAQIQRLEADAGHPPFVRSTRSVRLTPAGEVLLGYARTIFTTKKASSLGDALFDAAHHRTYPAGPENFRRRGEARAPSRAQRVLAKAYSWSAHCAQPCWKPMPSRD